MAPNTEVIIEIPCERKVPEVKKEKFTVTQEKPSEKTPLLGKKKEAKENDLTALSIVKKLDPAIVSLFIFLVVGTSVGLYLLCHEGKPTQSLSLKPPHTCVILSKITYLHLQTENH